MHKVLRAMSCVAVLGSCLYLAAPVLAADTAAPDNGGGELRQEGTALKEKMQQDHATMKADREKMEKDRATMMQDREKARALHKEMREKRHEHREEMKDKMMKNAPANGAPAATPAMPATPATPPAGQ